MNYYTIQSKLYLQSKFEKKRQNCKKENIFSVIMFFWTTEFIQNKENMNSVSQYITQRLTDNM
jgi:hypothetical protein